MEKPKNLRVSDFLDRAGVAVESNDDRLSVADTLIRGTFVHQQLRRGLFLHAGDVVEERTFTVTSSIEEGLSCVIFLDGEVDLDLGGRKFAFRTAPRSPIEGRTIVTSSTESFRRATRNRQHVSHLVVSATPEWFSTEVPEMLDGGSGMIRLLKDHLTSSGWALTPKTIELIRQIMLPSGYAPGLHRLYLESRAIEVMVEAIVAMTKVAGRTTPAGILTRQDHTRLNRAKDLIEDRLTSLPDVETIAREAGLSVSSLQRLFRKAESVSVFEFIRLRRLERAHEALRAGETSVNEASIIAGYSNPANFATAFRRRFGNSPREVKTTKR